MDRNLSLAEIARHFSLPESTARYYCKRFASFMPIIGEGRRKRYGQKTLEIIATIIEHMKMGKTAVLVEEELAAHFPRTMDATVTLDSKPSAFSPSNSHYTHHETGHDATSILGSTTVDFPTIPLSVPATKPGSASMAQNIMPSNNTMPSSGQMPPHDGGANLMVMQLLEQQTMAMQSIAKSLSVLSTQKEDMQRMEDAARTAKEENVLLRDEVKVLQSLLHSSEQVHHDDLNQIRSWMSRLAQSYNSKTTMDAQNSQSASVQQQGEQHDEEQDSYGQSDKSDRDDMSKM